MKRPSGASRVVARRAANDGARVRARACRRTARSIEEEALMAAQLRDDAGRARDALRSLDPGRPRDEWVRTAMAAKAARLDEDDFVAWSRAGHNFKSEADCRSVWRSIAPDGGVRAAGVQVGGRAVGNLQALWRRLVRRLDMRVCTGGVHAVRRRSVGGGQRRSDHASASAESAYNLVYRLQKLILFPKYDRYQKKRSVTL